MFWLLICMVFTTSGPGTDLNTREVMPPKIEITLAACQADEAKLLSAEVPDGVYVGVKCDGPFQDPTVPTKKAGP